jgi:hypothetical protein
LLLRSESFSLPSALFAGQYTMVMGLEPTPAKNEYGAKFACPPADRDETHAIGRGTTKPIKSL